MTSSSTTPDATTLIEIGDDRLMSVAMLKELLPDVEVALFFGKVYDLNYTRLSALLAAVFDTDVVAALTEGSHSTSLQDYVVGTVPARVLLKCKPSFVDAPPPGEVLPELWAQLETVVAESIKEVADTLFETIDLLPGKEGAMVFQHMATLNRQRPTLGDYRAQVKHARDHNNLLILDVSGSMTEDTIRTIIGDAVALGYKANATLAIVSETTTVWEPGAYSVDAVLDACEFWGTHYETLVPLLQHNWGHVITIADYDSSLSAKNYIEANAHGHIARVIDISLVNRPTFLSECVGQLADEVRPILIGNSAHVLS